MAVDERLDELRSELNPRVGRSTPEEIAHMWGPPDQRDTIGTSEYWTYQRSYGSRMAGAAVYNPYSHTSTFYGHARERSDRIVLEFQDGRLLSWRADVRR
jgi:hypothetical protein